MPVVSSWFQAIDVYRVTYMKTYRCIQYLQAYNLLPLPSNVANLSLLLLFLEAAPKLVMMAVLSARLQVANTVLHQLTNSVR